MPTAPTACSRLVRTDNSGKKQEGITCLLIDMKAPGVTVQPDHHAGWAARVQPGVLRRRAGAGGRPRGRGGPRVEHRKIPARAMSAPTPAMSRSTNATWPSSKASRATRWWMEGRLAEDGGISDSLIAEAEASLETLVDHVAPPAGDSVQRGQARGARRPPS